MVVGVGYKPPLPINGHCFSYGKTDSGKTWKNLAVAQFYHSHNYKIWDIFGGLRREGPFWSIPSDEITLWKEFLKSAGIYEFTGPKEYKVDFYIPYFYSKVPNKLPQKLPRVSTHIFTIDFKTLNVKDLAVVMGNVSGNQERVLKRIQKELPNNANGQDILNWFEETEKRKKMKSLPIYYNFFEPLCREKLLEGPKGKYILDLVEISKERDRIFVLYEDYIPEEKYRFLFMMYIARILFDLVNNNKINIKNIVFLREINYFMKVDDVSIQYKEQKQVLREEFSNLLRYGRSGVFVICDTQSPREVRGITPGQEGLIILNRLPGEKDREEACERPRKDGRLNSTHIAYLATMPIHEMAVLEQGKNIKKINRVQPPRTMGWKPTTGNFLKVWKEKYNEFIDIHDIKEDIDNLYKTRFVMEIKDEEEYTPEVVSVVTKNEEVLETKKEEEEIEAYPI